MAVIIDISEDAIKKIEKIRFLIGGKEDRDLQFEIINAIKNRKSTDEMIAEIRDYSNKYTTINVNTKKVVVEALLCIIHKYCDEGAEQ